MVVVTFWTEVLCDRHPEVTRGRGGIVDCGDEPTREIWLELCTDPLLLDTFAPAGDEDIVWREHDADLGSQVHFFPRTMRQWLGSSSG